MSTGEPPEKRTDITMRPRASGAAARSSRTSASA